MLQVTTGTSNRRR